MFDGFNKIGEQFEENEKLIEKYPFLKVKEAEYYNPISNRYEYGFTWLDDLEPGWKEAFGECLCKELSNAIKEDSCEDEFEFVQIKEKYGSLRLYAVGYGDNTQEVLSKYEELSKYICGHCGKPATKITTGWYYPLCDECFEKIQGGYEDIWQWYGFDSLEEVQKEIDHIITSYKYNEYWTNIRKAVENKTDER